MTPAVRTGVAKTSNMDGPRKGTTAMTTKTDRFLHFHLKAERRAFDRRLVIMYKVSSDHGNSEDRENKSQVPAIPRSATVRMAVVAGELPRARKTPRWSGSLAGLL